MGEEYGAAGTGRGAAGVATATAGSTTPAGEYWLWAVWLVEGSFWWRKERLMPAALPRRREVEAGSTETLGGVDDVHELL